MYIEFNNRQTGKTTRLVRAVVDYLADTKDGHAIIIGHNFASSEHIRKEVGKLIQLEYSNQGRRMYQRVTISGVGDRLRGRTGKRFWDEFSFRDTDEVEWRAQDYYCTSYHNENERRIDKPIIVNIPYTEPAAAAPRVKPLKLPTWWVYLNKEWADFGTKHPVQAHFVAEEGGDINFYVKIDGLEKAAIIATFKKSCVLGVVLQQTQ